MNKITLQNALDAGLILHDAGLLHLTPAGYQWLERILENAAQVRPGVWDINHPGDLQQNTAQLLATAGRYEAGDRALELSALPPGDPDQQLITFRLAKPDLSYARTQSRRALETNTLYATIHPRQGWRTTNPFAIGALLVASAAFFWALIR